ncbi:MAG: hypothetical protein WDM80_06195 [Limisphaerales bacterium]
MPEFSRIALPYDLYTDDDLAHRIIYVEASRGCPFMCEFCLSSLDIPVRQVPLPAFLDQMQRLLDRGVKQFKFVDRTFNLNIATSKALLEFFLARYQPGHFYHFEMIPTACPPSCAKSSPNFSRARCNLKSASKRSIPKSARISAAGKITNDSQITLIFCGVKRCSHSCGFDRRPAGETLESFAAGFDKLVALGPQEIQVGILKRLRGTPITRHDSEWQMVYGAHPPYEILQNKLLDSPRCKECAALRAIGI